MSAVRKVSRCWHLMNKLILLFHDIRPVHYMTILGHGSSTTVKTYPSLKPRLSVLGFVLHERWSLEQEALVQGWPLPITIKGMVCEMNWKSDHIKIILCDTAASCLLQQQSSGVVVELHICRVGLLYKFSQSVGQWKTVFIRVQERQCVIHSMKIVW